MLNEALAAMESWEAIRAVRTSPVLYPLLSGTHILAFSVLVGCIVLFDLRVLRSPANAPADVLPLARAAFGVAAPTGLVLFACRASAYAVNPAFWIKLGLMVLAVANVGLFHALHRRSRLAAKASASASLAGWTGVVFAGRWIGFS